MKRRFVLATVTVSALPWAATTHAARVGVRSEESGRRQDSALVAAVDSFTRAWAAMDSLSGVVMLARGDLDRGAARSFRRDS